MGYAMRYLEDSSARAMWTMEAQEDSWGNTISIWARDHFYNILAKKKKKPNCFFFSALVLRTCLRLNLKVLGEFLGRKI